MRTSLGVLSLILMVPTLSAIGQGVSLLKQNPAISIDLSPVESTVKLGSPVELMVTLMNRSNHDVVVLLSKAGAEGSYHVEVRDDRGNLPDDTRYGLLHNGHIDVNSMKEEDWKRMGFTTGELLSSGVVFPFTLKAGKSFKTSLFVAALYEFKNPGKYTIYVEKYSGGENQDSEKFLNKSNSVTVTVIP